MGKSTFNILFIAMFLIWLVGWGRLHLSRAATRWVLITIVVTSVSSIVAVAKTGGGSNSYLPVFFVMSLFSVALLGGLVGDCNSLLYRPVGYALTAIIDLLIVADFNAVPGALNWYKPGPRLGDANYHAIIKRVGVLPGVVLCPDDPTIPLLAKGQLSRNFMVERDVRGQRSTPKYVLSQWETGDWMVLVAGTWTSRVPRDVLQRLGYRPRNDPFFRGTSYSLWQKQPRERLE